MACSLLLAYCLGCHLLLRSAAYRQLGAEVHLDGQAVEDWAHMAQADVLVVAPSGFSWVAGILNSKCVVGFESYPYAYHPSWIKLNQHFSNLEELRRCLLKLSPS